MSVAVAFQKNTWNDYTRLALQEAARHTGQLQPDIGPLSPALSNKRRHYCTIRFEKERKPYFASLKNIQYTAEYKILADKLVNYHNNLLALSPPNPVACISSDIASMISLFDEMDRARIVKATLTFLFKSSGGIGLVTLISSLFARKYAELFYSLLIAGSILSTAALCFRYIEQICLENNLRLFKTNYEAIGRLAEKILYSLTHYDDQMTLQPAPLLGYKPIYSVFDDPNFRPQGPPEEMLANITYNTEQVS